MHIFMTVLMSSQYLYPDSHQQPHTVAHSDIREVSYATQQQEQQQCDDILFVKGVHSQHRRRACGQ